MKLYKKKLLRFSVLSAAAVAVTFLLGSAAFAGSCPAGKEGANALAGAPTAPVGVSEAELASVDLSTENVHLDQRRLRLRHMTIQAGGIVPLHSHADRPALILVNSGEIFENSSQCTVPILHKAGEVSKEHLGTMHWWKNETDKPVELTIGDIVNDKKPETMQKMM